MVWPMDRVHSGPRPLSMMMLSTVTSLISAISRHESPSTTVYLIGGSCVGVEVGVTLAVTVAVGVGRGVNVWVGVAVSNRLTTAAGMGTVPLPMRLKSRPMPISTTNSPRMKGLG